MPPILKFLARMIWNISENALSSSSPYIPSAYGVYRAGKSLYDNFNKTRAINAGNFNSALDSLGLRPNYDSSSQKDYISRTLSASGLDNTRNASRLLDLYSQFSQQKQQADKLDSFRGNYEQ